MTPKAWYIKENYDKLDFIKILNFCLTTEWKNFANHIPDKALVSIIYKEPIKLNKKTSNPIKKKLGKVFK